MDQPVSALNLRGGFVLYPSQLQAIEKVMVALIDKMPATFACLVESSGQVVCSQFNPFYRDKETLDVQSLGVLVAGDLAASQEIARLTGEYQAYQLVMREGQTGSTFISEAGKSMVLFVQVSRDVPIGWARILIIETARKIAEAMIAAKPSDAPRLELAQDNLQDQLNDALDSMWGEEPNVR